MHRSLALLTALLLAGCSNTGGWVDRGDMNTSDQRDMSVAIDMSPNEQDMSPAPRDMNPAHDMSDMSDMPVDMSPCAEACTDGRVCDPASGQCVGCLLDAHCADPKPRCDAATNTCEECVTSDHCAGHPGGAMCAPDGRCVECLEQAHCTTPERAVCNTGSRSCEGCTSNDDCKNTSGHPYCDMASGACVACTLATEGVDCKKRISGRDWFFTCDPGPGVCTNVERGSLTACQPCVSDVQCDTANDYLCVPMKYKGVDLPGGFCLKNYGEDGFLDTCPRPFGVKGLNMTSLGGVVSNFCSINQEISTCYAVLAYLGDVDCSSDPLLCGESGVCHENSEGARYCTVACGDNSEECLFDLMTGTGDTCQFKHDRNICIKP